MMPSFVYKLLSLTTIVILSFAQPDNLDLTGEYIAQSLMAPVASLDGSGGPAIAIGTSGEADVSSTGPDASIVAQAAVARPAANGCPKGRIRRRGDGAFCSSTDAPTSSQQNPQNGDEQPSNGEAGQQKQQDSPENWKIFAPMLEHTCPDGYSAVCAAPNLIENPLAPGTYTRIPWVEHNIPPTISIEEYSRLWLPWDPCKTMDGEELFMCCKKVWPRFPGSEMWGITPDRAAFLKRYYIVGYECTPREMPANLP